MILGVDFDNTIVSYEGLFHRIAVENGWIPETVCKSKDRVRDYMRIHDNEVKWTKLQGIVYGTKMELANPFNGVKKFFGTCKESHIPIRIISHKSRFPYIGERFDLHEAASLWLESHGFIGTTTHGIPKENIYFELTKEAKIDRIKTCGCTHFIDDLPELLMHHQFPQKVERILYDPHSHHRKIQDIKKSFILG